MSFDHTDLPIVSVSDVEAATGGVLSRFQISRHLARVRLGGRWYCRVCDVATALGDDVAARAVAIASGQHPVPETD